LWRWHLCLSDQPVEEGSVGEETVLILRVSQLLEELLGVLLGDGVSYNVGKNVEIIDEGNFGISMKGIRSEDFVIFKKMCVY